VKNNIQKIKTLNLRSESRTKSLKNARVEFKPAKDSMSYHFKLKNFSSEGFGILVRKDSKVLQYIKPGDILTMTYYPDLTDLTETNPIPYQTQIKHISEPGPGKHHDHLLVGFLIFE
jgi:hypothetical protein